MTSSMSEQQLSALIFASLEGVASQDQIDQLETRLQEDPQARRFYSEFLIIYTGLRQSGAQLLASTTATPQPQTPLSSERVRQIEQYASQQLEAYLTQEHPRPSAPARAYSPERDLVEVVHHFIQGAQRIINITIKAAKVALICGIMLLAGLILRAHIKAHAVVATLQQTAHDRWENKPQGPELRRGWLTLDEGYAQIRFKKGARVLLQAPCHVRLVSPGRMFLESGTVTARVPSEAIGFTIETPSSIFEDFGTEFGVLVDTTNESEIHVFDGDVGVSSAAHRSTAPQHHLLEGQSALTDLNGQIHIDQSRYGARQFLREMPDLNQTAIPGKQLNMADLMGGGNGFGSGHLSDGVSAVGSINPITGHPDDPSRPQTPWNPDALPAPHNNRYDYYHYRCSNDYIRVPKLPCIDGVFVPDGSQGPSVVSSAGHIFRECPRTDGLVKWNIINGWRYRNRHDPIYTNAHLSQATGLSLAANIGITFDLEAIRSTMPGIKITAFQSNAGVPISPDPARTEVDLWVLVDGEVHFKQQNVRYPTVCNIQVSLHPSDRFLTLVVTDSQTPKPATHYSNMDWCFWENPVLELGSARPAVSKSRAGFQPNKY